MTNRYLDLSDCGDPPSRLMVGMRLLAYIAAPSSPEEREEIVLTLLSDVIAEAKHDIHQPIADLEVRLRARRGDPADRLLLKFNTGAYEELGRFEDAVIPMLAHTVIQASLNQFHDRHVGGIERVGVIARAPGADKVVHKFVLGIGRAITAGRLLRLYMAGLRIEEQIKRKASMNRVIAVVQKFPRPGAPRDKSEINHLWKNYRPIAHLAAALMQIASDLGFDPSMPTPQNLRDVVTQVLKIPTSILQIALPFERYLEVARSPGTVKPLLPPDKIWRVPPFAGRNDQCSMSELGMSADELKAYRDYPLKA